VYLAGLVHNKTHNESTLTDQIQIFMNQLPAALRRVLEQRVIDETSRHGPSVRALRKWMQKESDKHTQRVLEMMKSKIMDEIKRSLNRRPHGIPVPRNLMWSMDQDIKPEIHMFPSEYKDVKSYAKDVSQTSGMIKRRQVVDWIRHCNVKRLTEVTTMLKLDPVKPTIHRTVPRLGRMALSMDLLKTTCSFLTMEDLLLGLAPVSMNWLDWIWIQFPFLVTKLVLPFYTNFFSRKARERVRFIDGLLRPVFRAKRSVQNAPSRKRQKTSKDGDSKVTQTENNKNMAMACKRLAIRQLFIGPDMWNRLNSIPQIVFADVMEVGILLDDWRMPAHLDKLIEMTPNAQIVTIIPCHLELGNAKGTSASMNGFHNFSYTGYGSGPNFGGAITSVFAALNAWTRVHTIRIRGHPLTPEYIFLGHADLERDMTLELIAPQCALDFSAHQLDVYSRIDKERITIKCGGEKCLGLARWHSSSAIPFPLVECKH